jgi:N utilization substance protein B
MISRRIIRTKVLQLLYAHVTSSEKTLQQSESELQLSIKKTYDLYQLLLALPGEVQRYAEEKIESRKMKKLPSEEDLNPNLKFIQNRLISRLNNDRVLDSYLNKNKLSWMNHRDLVKKIYQLMIESDLYIDYINSPVNTFADDRRFCEDFFSTFLINCEPLQNELEERSIYWNDDLDFVISMILKTLKKFQSEDDANQYLMPLYKDEEDEEFTVKLMRKSILNNETNRKIIENYTRNWDVDRVAVMDILIMELALTELTEFPSIPVKVTLNEYIELAKYYSTSKSSNFINGVLDRITKDFQEEGKIKKSGRGLMEG